MDEIDLSHVEPKKPSHEPYVGDLNKTQIIFNLVKIPPEQRDAAWAHRFLLNVAAASFKCGEPQVVRGPDGFPYFQLFLPEPGVKFQSFVLDKMKDDFILEKGFGVVINPSESRADWVFSYGDILHYHLKGTLEYPEKAKNSLPEKFQEGEKALIASPSEAMLPKMTKKILNDLLKANGLTIPKVLLMRRVIGEMTEDYLAFNITPHTFQEENKFQGVLRALSWYFPRNYSIVGLDETQSDFQKGFQPLEEE